MSVTGSLIIKDGTGALASLSVYSSSNGYIPEHAISGTISISSSLTSPVYVDQIKPTTNNRITGSVSDGSINWASANSGTYVVGNYDSTRKGLIITNDNSVNMYVAIGNATVNNKNGFTLSNTASAPSSFSFVIYPSGAYFADSTTVTLQHSVYFVSSSINLKILATTIN
jgi:hypothetical protein